MNSRHLPSVSSSDSLENAITSALEQPQATLIPADFAARVAAQAATVPLPRRAPRAGYARSISLFLGGLLLVALFVVAPHAQPTFLNLEFDVELLLVTLLGGLGYWLTHARETSL